jgi:hypothetical protein
MEYNCEKHHPSPDFGKPMNRIVVTTRIGSDGSLHLDLPVGPNEADTEVQVTVEPVAAASRRPLLASDLLKSDLVGMWAGRTDIADNHDFARRLREQAQTRRRDS